MPALLGPPAVEAGDGNPLSRVFGEMSVEKEEAFGESRKVVLALLKAR